MCEEFVNTPKLKVRCPHCHKTTAIPSMTIPDYVCSFCKRIVMMKTNSAGRLPELKYII